MSYIQKNLEEYRGDTVSYLFNVDPSYLVDPVTCFLTVKRNPDDSSPLISIEFLRTDDGADWDNGILAKTVTGHNVGVAGGLYIWDIKTIQTGLIKTHYRGGYYLIGNITDLNQVSTYDYSDLVLQLASTTDPTGASLIGVDSTEWAALAGSKTVENALTDLKENKIDEYTRSASNKIMVSGADEITIAESNLQASGNDINLPAGGRVLIDSVQIDTDDVNEGSNLYYTQARFDSAFTAKDTDDLSQGVTNKYYASSLFDTDFATKDTDDLSEGSTNQYFTSARVQSSIESIITTKGDLLTRSASGAVRLPVGTNGQVLVADSTETNGIKWSSLGSDKYSIGYLSLRGEINSSTALRIFAGAVIQINALMIQLTSNTDISQVGTPAASWYYVLIDESGTLSLEAIPGGHITANTIVYMPNPDSTYSATLNGHYSTVSTTKRIITNAFWDGSAWTEIDTLSTGYFERNELFYDAYSASNTGGTSYYQHASSSYALIRGNGITGNTTGDITFTTQKQGLVSLTWETYLIQSAVGAGNDIRVYYDGSPIRPSLFEVDPIVASTGGRSTLHLEFYAEKGKEIKFLLNIGGTLSGSNVGNIRLRLN